VERCIPLEYTCLSNNLFAIVYTSLALMLIYYVYKPSVSKLIALYITLHTTKNYFLQYY